MLSCEKCSSFLRKTLLYLHQFLCCASAGEDKEQSMWRRITQSAQVTKALRIPLIAPGVCAVSRDTCLPPVCGTKQAHSAGEKRHSFNLSSLGKCAHSFSVFPDQWNPRPFLFLCVSVRVCVAVGVVKWSYFNLQNKRICSDAAQSAEMEPNLKLKQEKFAFHRRSATRKTNFFFGDRKSRLLV